MEDEKNIIIVLDCYTEWCAPCKIYEKIYEKVAEKYKGKALFLRINLEKDRILIDKYNVKAVPTTLIIKGEIIGKLTGAVPTDKLIEFINEHVK